MGAGLHLLALVLGLVLASPSSSSAQPGAKPPRIGFLSSGGDTPTPLLSGFRQGLREHGYIEGQTIHVEYRWAQGHFERLPQLAAELVASDVEVIVSTVTAASLAARTATNRVPIVMVGVADPVGVGLVASLARPGGNVTGTSTLQVNMAAKQLELVRVLDPALSRVGVLWNPANAAFQALQVGEAQAEARASGLQLQLVEARTRGDFSAALAALRESGAGTLVVLSDPTFVTHRSELMRQALGERLITICGSRDDAEAGCLVSYSPSYFNASRRAAAYVDKILKGARPADLPVELPTRFDLIINAKTAGTLGLTISPSLLARADEVIE